MTVARWSVRGGSDGGPRERLAHGHGCWKDYAGADATLEFK
jgi:hypothetical protein